MTHGVQTAGKRVALQKMVRQRQLYLMGQPLLRVLPYVPLGMNQLITVAIISYNGHLDCGITADYDSTPDMKVMVDGIESALAELSARAPVS